MLFRACSNALTNESSKWRACWNSASREKGRVAVGAAAERGAIRRRRRHDQRVFILQRLDVAARIAGRHDDDAPLDAGFVEHLAQHLRRKLVQLQRRKLGSEPIVAAAVAFQEDQHHVVVAIDRRADLVQRLAQIADGRQRRVEHRTWIVDQRYRAAIGVETLVEELPRGDDVLAKHVFRGVRREADEIQIGDARPLVLEVGERLVEQARLRGERLLRRRARIARVARFGGRRRRPPRRVGQQRRKQPHRAHQHRGGHHRAQAVVRPRRREAHGRRAPEPEQRPQRQDRLSADGLAEKVELAQRPANQRAHDLQRPLAGEHDHRQRHCIVGLPERARQQGGKQHQDRAEEHLADEAVHREHRIRVALNPVDGHIDQRRKDEQRQELRHADAEIQARYRQSDRDAPAPGDVATQIAKKYRHRHVARYQAARSAMYDFTAATSGGSTA